MLAVRLLIAACSIAGTALSAAAGVPSDGPRPAEYPDVIVSELGGSLTKYGTLNGVSAYAFTTVSCNIGYHDAIWISGGEHQNQHPVIGQSMYRIYDGRCEQVGLSWLKHGFCAADASDCMNLVDQSQWNVTRGGLTLADPQPSFSPRDNVSCNWLGLFKTDTYSASLNSQQSNLGPRSEVNAWSGQFPYPYILESNVNGSCINKRLQVANSDLRNAPGDAYEGARYFVECQYVVTDEWPAQRYNNVSRREVTIGPWASQYFYYCGNDEIGPELYTYGDTVAMSPAIDAWQQLYPDVKLVTVDVPNDGRLIVGSLATDNGDGTWTYEYAVYNMNCNRGVRSFAVPAGYYAAQASGFGFHDVVYHSGEPQDGTDWTPGVNVGGASVAWQTQTYDQNIYANAIRWGTLYNFRFTSTSAPATGQATLGLFLPGDPTDPTGVVVAGLDVANSGPLCAADFNGFGGVTQQDIFDYLNAWLAGDASADFNGHYGVTVQDIFDFLTAWLAGCH